MSGTSKRLAEQLRRALALLPRTREQRTLVTGRNRYGQTSSEVLKEADGAPLTCGWCGELIGDPDSCWDGLGARHLFATCVREQRDALRVECDALRVERDALRGQLTMIERIALNVQAKLDHVLESASLEGIEPSSLLPTPPSDD